MTESVGVEPGILILSPVVTARLGLQRSEKCHKGIERCERKEELVLEKQAYCRVCIGTEHEEINTAGQTK